MPVDRFDTAILPPLPKTSAGYLRVPGKLTRIGVLSYVQPDGTIRKEFRSEEEVFHVDSLDSMRLVPVTHGHPKGGLDSKSAQPMARGAVGDVVTRDGDHVAATVGIFDQALIEAIERGESELSCGYVCDMDLTPGEWNGEKYDAKQTNIRYNHLAVVPRGRAGHTVALKLDQEDTKKMAVLKIADKEYECPQEVADAFNALASVAKADAAERDAHKVRADAAEAAAKVAPAAPDVRELVKARVALEREVVGVVAEDKMDALDDAQLKTELIKSVLPSMKLDGYTGDMINAAYGAAIAARPGKGASQMAAVRAAGAQRNDSKPDAYAAMVARQANAWKAKKE